MNNALERGNVRIATRKEGAFSQGIYLLLDIRREDVRQWEVLVLEADPMDDEYPGEVRVLNTDWLSKFTVNL